MHIAVAEENQVLIAELVIEAAGRLVFARVERKHSAASFKLAVQERIPRDLSRVQARRRRYSQSAGQRGGTSRGRYWELPIEARHGGRASAREPLQNRNLITRWITLRAKNFGIREKGNGVLRVLAQAFKSGEQEGLVLLDREAQCPAVLLAAQGVFHVSASNTAEHWASRSRRTRPSCSPLLKACARTRRTPFPFSRIPKFFARKVIQRIIRLRF